MVKCYVKVGAVKDFFTAVGQESNSSLSLLYIPSLSPSLYLPSIHVVFKPVSNFLSPVFLGYVFIKYFP